MGLAVLVHVAISLVGIGTGLVVVYGFLSNKTVPSWTHTFLWSTMFTSLTGFALPAKMILPSHITGFISVAVLIPTFIAWYKKHLAGHWRWVYVSGAVAAFYLNVFVLVAQLFLKVPALRAVAPTQSEPPFVMMQLIVLAMFIGYGYLSLKNFRPAIGQPVR